MKKLPFLTAALLGSAVALRTPFADTNSGRRFFICATPQPNNLDAAGFAALTWVEVTGIGSLGETGISTNILTYDTWDEDVIQKGKGQTDGGSPELELARKPNDAGQILLNALALTPQNYAIKTLLNNAATEGGTGTVRYNRGIITGPRNPNGRNEDFEIDIFTFGLNQRQITVNPLSGNPPVNTVLPAITGTAQVASTLTGTNGTWVGDATITYSKQWKANGVAIPGAVAATYQPTPDTVGKYISLTVTATNAAGVVVATSASTAAVIA